ncbi:MAG: TRAP transporter large permease subunit, partial [Burkholderiaceae bacterium]
MTDDPVLTAVVGLLAMFIMILLHVPVGVAMGAVGVVGTGLIIGFEPALTLLATEPSAAMAAEGLAVIAMFLLMGNLAHAGGLSDELYRLAHVAVGHFKGGLLFATIAACAGFGAICGSSVATTATMAKIALPQMLSRGYAKSIAAGAIASGGTLGMIIPPSVVMILYAILTENSIIALFLAAIVPG